MLGRTARLLRSPPQHICLPCLRRQLLQSVATRPSSLAGLRPALFHTTSGVQDQVEAERSNSLSRGSSPPLPKPNDSAPSVDASGETQTAAKGRSQKRAKGRAKGRARVRAKGKKDKSTIDQVSQDPEQEKAQESPLSEDLEPNEGQDSEAKPFVAGQLENHATLSEVLRSPEKENGVVRRVSQNYKATTTSAGRRGARRKSPGRISISRTKGTAEKGAVSDEEGGHNQGDLANGNEYQSLSATDLHLTPLDVEQPPVPALAYGLDRVLFNPGVYHLQDPRTQVFNFDPYLSNVMPVPEFNFNSLGEYITSSRDNALSDLAREHQKTFVGSTSSMTSSLAHFHYLLSSWRPINTATLSRAFPEKLTNFTKLNRLPASVFLRYKNGVYSIDADKEFDSSNILAMLGKSLEKLLTLPTEEYERYRISNPNQISEEERKQPESYHYTSMGDILMRSQLDARDPRLPGTGMFDLKTRAVVSIRMDVRDWDQYTGYQIKGDLGKFESFEREQYDMMRSMLLKYSLQARMGRMDGIFVAYHNIERIFGFQYMSLEEMDFVLHGVQDGRRLGDQEFRLSIGLLNKVLRQAIEKFPETSLRIQFETRESRASPWMYIFAEPMEECDIQAIQDTNKEQIEAFERRVLGLESQDEEATTQDVAASDDVFEESAAETIVAEEETSSNDTFDAAEEANPADSEESKASEEVVAKMETGSDDAASERATAEEDEVAETTEGAAPDERSPAKDTGRPLLALKLFATNMVDGERVTRPNSIGKESDWTVNYTMSEVENPEKAMALFRACRKRRHDGFSASMKETEQDKVLSHYQRILKTLSENGRSWREKRDQELERRGKVVYESHRSTEPQRLGDLDTYLSWLYRQKGRNN